MLILPLRGKFHGARRRAAKSVVYRCAFSEVRAKIFNRKIDNYLDINTEVEDSFQSKRVLAVDLQKTPVVTIAIEEGNKFEQSDKFQGFCSELSDAFISSSVPINESLNESPENYLPFDGYITDIE